MFQQEKQIYATAESIAEKVGIEAEGFYRSVSMNCAESVLMATRNQFFPSVPQEIVLAASGFGGGSGAGCICGAVAGGTIACGFLLSGDKRELKRITKGLHEWFKHEYGASCCRVATKNAKDKGGCAVLTGEVAKKVAEFLES